MVRYVRDNFYSPLATKLLAAGLTVDIDTVNIKGRQWLNEMANVRVHDTTKEQPIVRLMEERAALQARPFEPLKEININKTRDTITSLDFDHQPLHHDLSIYNDYCQVDSL